MKDGWNSFVLQDVPQAMTEKTAFELEIFSLQNDPIVLQSTESVVINFKWTCHIRDKLTTSTKQ